MKKFNTDGKVCESPVTATNRHGKYCDDLCELNSPFTAESEIDRLMQSFGDISGTNNTKKD